MPPKAKLINTSTVVGGNIHFKARKMFSDPIGARNKYFAWWQTRLINGTVIAVHESTSEKPRKKRIVEASYIFRAQ